MTINVSTAAENCEGGCGAQVFTVTHAGGERRPELREVGKHGSVAHTAARCRGLRDSALVKAAEKAEAKRVVRHFQRYTSEQRASKASAHTQGHRQKQAVGEYFYTHPDRPGIAFTTRGQAARAGLAA